MNPLIVLEKKYIDKFNFSGAALIAFLKEKGGVYNGSLKELSKEMGIMSLTGIVKVERKLEILGIIKAEKSKRREYRYILDEDVLEGRKYLKKEQEIKEELPEQTPEVYVNNHKIPKKVQDLVDKIQEIRENKKKKMQ